MNLQTIVHIPDPPFRINYTTPCLLMGSCFSDYIGVIMEDYCFPVLLNPFGTLFNPASIQSGLMNLVHKKIYHAGDLRFHDGRWLSFDHYTGFTHADRDKCLAHINESVAKASIWLKNAGYLILTFGTAWIYRLHETRQIVANCHKIPQSEFSKELMKPGEIVMLYDDLLSELRAFNSKLKIIFTISPVRHWADGAVNNQLSKSILHFGLSEILKRNENTSYFPSYEIYMDELRDYRFYAADMLHPSKQGAEYIWERFTATWCDDETRTIMKKVDPVIRALRHRPVNPDSESYKKFRESTENKIAALKNQYPFLNFPD